MTFSEYLGNYLPCYSESHRYTFPCHRCCGKILSRPHDCRRWCKAWL